MKKILLGLFSIVLLGATYISFKLYSNYQKMNEVDKKYFQALVHKLSCIGKPFTEAKSCYRKAIAIDPYHFEAYFSIAQLKAKNKDCFGSAKESQAATRAFQAYMKLDRKIISRSRARSFFQDSKETMSELVANCKVSPENLAETNKLLNEVNKILNVAKSSS